MLSEKENVSSDLHAINIKFVKLTRRIRQASSHQASGTKVTKNFKICVVGNENNSLSGNFSKKFYKGCDAI